MKRYFYPQRYVLRPEDAPAMKAQALDAALDRLAVIEQRLQKNGPYHLGARFSLVDLTMAYWTAYVDFIDALGPYPAVRHCTDLVMDRPKLRRKFDELKTLKHKYAQLQAQGAGVP